MLHYVKAIPRALMPALRGIWGYFQRYSKHPEKMSRDKKYKKIHRLMTRVNKALQVEVIVENPEYYLGDTYCMYCPNHLAYYDPLPFLDKCDKNITFVAKKEAEDFLVIGTCIKYLEGLFMDRDDIKSSLQVMKYVENSFKESNDQSWFIFPEGKRHLDPMEAVFEFHHGTFRSAMRAQKPIVPVAIYGTFRPLKRKPQYKKYPVHIKYLKPLYYEDYKDMTSQQVAQLVEDEVAKTVAFELRRKDHEYMLKYNSKNYRFNEVK